MPIIIDIGVAPANEDCAQLGITPDYRAANRLEVLAYRAAIIAVHGAPPNGCRLEPKSSHHDFGSYCSLTLIVSDEASVSAAHAYIAAVESGLGNWIEAAMAPPITYREGIARWHKRTASDVVFGVLMSTRPDDDGHFRIPAFATIHANLSASYEAEAARFAALQGELA
ncbi:MAG: hypothetical protein C0496_17930 [Erythrobacter sp.]|nr:hypothetical protein [Erythrobacter sp.]